MKKSIEEWKKEMLKRNKAKKPIRKSKVRRPRPKPRPRSILEVDYEDRPKIKPKPRPMPDVWGVGEKPEGRWWGGHERPSDWSKGRKKPRPPPNLELLEKQLEKALKDKERHKGKVPAYWWLQNRRIEELQKKIHNHPDYVPPKPPSQIPPGGVGVLLPWQEIMSGGRDKIYGEGTGPVHPIQPPPPQIGRKPTPVQPPRKGESSRLPREPRAITMKIGEYDDRLPPPRKGESSRLPREPRAITMKIGEYDDRLPDRNVTTLALGEEDGMVGKPIRPPPRRPSRGIKEQRVRKDRIRKIKQAHGQKPILPKPKHPHGKPLIGSKSKTNLEKLHALNRVASKRGGARVSKLKRKRDALARKLNKR